MMKYYVLREKYTGEFSCGTGLYTTPKLYTLGSAKSAASFKNNQKHSVLDIEANISYIEEWEVISVELILQEEQKIC